MNTRNINITVTGSNNKGKELVSNVITNALTKEGFMNVALVTPHGEPMVGSDVPSLMDVMKQYDPAFLETPINVIGIPESQADAEEDGSKITAEQVGEVEAVDAAADLAS